MKVPADSVPLANSQEKRHGKVDIYRFLFALVVCVYHFELIYYDGTRYVNAGYIGVEFFLILSGVFLMRSAVDGSRTPVSYAVSRITRLYPHYLFSFAVFFAATSFAMLRSEQGIFSVARKLVSHVFELTILQMAVPKCAMLNRPAWYVSALLISSVAVYGLAARFRRTLLRAAPVLVCLIYVFFAWKAGNIHVWWGTGVWLFRDGLLRAAAGLLLGCLCYVGCEHGIQPYVRGGFRGPFSYSSQLVRSWYSQLLAASSSAIRTPLSTL